MRRIRVKTPERIVAFLLALLMVAALIPITTMQALAETTNYSDSFTVTVTDGKDPIEGATVALQNQDNTWTLELSGTTDANGVAAFDTATIQQALTTAGIEDGTVVASVSKEGYDDNTGSIAVTATDAVKNIDVVLLESPPAGPQQATISVSVTGDATVKVNNMVQNSASFAVRSLIPVEITPAEGTYIKSLTVGGQSVSVTKGKAYSGWIWVEQDTEIVATVVKEYTVTAPAVTGGTIELDSRNVESLTVDENKSVSVKVAAAAGYQISSVSIDGENQTVSDVAVFERNVSVTKDIAIVVTFVKVYTVTVTKNGNGTVVTDPVGGTVTVKEDSTVTVTATPDPNYRVSKVKVNGGEDRTVTGANDSTYSTSLAVDKDYTIVITFAPNRYAITKTATQNGSIELGSTIVDHGSSCDVTITPATGYSVADFTVNGQDVSAYETSDTGGATFTISNITEAKEISATFVATAMDSSEIPSLFNSTDAVRVDGLTYIYKNNDTVTFTIDKDGIRLLNGRSVIGGNKSSNTVTISQTTEITQIQLYYKAEGEKVENWHTVTGINSLNPLKIVIDKTGANTTLTPDEPNSFGYYKDDVAVDVQAVDPGDYSGLASIEYFVTATTVEGTYDEILTENKTQSGTLYTYDSEITDTWTGSISVDAALNNSEHVVVWVKTVDRGGNITITKTDELKINSTAPKLVSVEMNGTIGSNGTASYYNTTRTAVITMTDWASTFDESAANQGITISAVDAKGEAVSISKPEMISWTHDGDTHAATIVFEADANYNWSITYTNKAGAELDKSSVAQTGDSLYKFTIDTKIPTGTVKATSSEGRVVEWKTLRETLTFGFWSRDEIVIAGTFEDETSASMKSVEYYKVSATSASDGTTALTAADLDKITAWNVFQGLTLSSDEQCTVYIRITDLAGNYTYISTNGLIVDHTIPQEETINPEITTTPEQPINGIYSEAVKVDIKVTDPLVGGTYSGLKTITYQVLNMGQETQSGILYEFNNADPKQSDLLRTWEGSITVDSTLNNSNDVVIVIYAEDNSLNSSSDHVSIKIDTTAPAIMIDYDNNNVNGDAFFRDNRTATVIVTERNFNADDVRINITNTDGTMPIISGFSKIAGSGNEDNTMWVATIRYEADGDYTFNINYKDLANHVCPGAMYVQGTVAATEFTIDKTIPVINVSYDNNNAQNGNYYSGERRATIVITEHNFDAAQVDVSITATDDGAQASVPTVSGWTSEGDKRTATVYYANDAQYTFDISMRDQAGNEAADYAEDTFIVDMTLPVLEITGVADNSANTGDVIPVVSYSDTNYDFEQVTITLDGANRGRVALDGTYANVHNGRTFTFNNFAEEKEVDDIYTLTAALTDRAGNSTTETITFSVNRFGSNYVMDESTGSLNGTYVQNPIDIVVTETNANELKNIRVTLFKNNETLVLKEGEDYRLDVTGGNGEWYRYTYTVFAKNFEDDGVYRLTFHSEDAAGNTAENTLDVKDAEISFGVDRTKPNIVVTNLESTKTYALENLTVEMSASDNLVLSAVSVYLDDYNQAYKTWNAEEIVSIVANNEDFTFDIPGDVTSEHQVMIVCLDAAGNEQIEEITDFYVTTDILVRYYNNKPLFVGSIVGVVLLAGVVVFLIVWRRKKERTDVV